MKLSTLTKGQWISVVKNAILAGAAAYAATGTTGKVALIAGVMAAFKIVEKSLTAGA